MLGPLKASTQAENKCENQLNIESHSPWLLPLCSNILFVIWWSVWRVKVSDKEMDQEKQNSSFYISPNSTSFCYPLSSWPQIPNSFLSSTKKAVAASNHQGEIFAAKKPGGGKLTHRCQVSEFPFSPHRFSSLLKRVESHRGNDLPRVN